MRHWWIWNAKTRTAVSHHSLSDKELKIQCIPFICRSVTWKIHSHLSRGLFCLLQKSTDEKASCVIYAKIHAPIILHEKKLINANCFTFFFFFFAHASFHALRVSDQVFLEARDTSPFLFSAVTLLSHHMLIHDFWGFFTASVYTRLTPSVAYLTDTSYSNAFALVRSSLMSLTANIWKCYGRGKFLAVLLIAEKMDMCCGNHSRSFPDLPPSFVLSRNYTFSEGSDKFLLIFLCTQYVTQQSLTPPPKTAPPPFPIRLCC